MRALPLHLLAVSIAGLAACASPAERDAEESTPRGHAVEHALRSSKIHPEVSSRLDAEGAESVDVIVRVARPPSPGEHPGARRAAVRAALDRTLERSSWLTVRRRFDNVAAFGATVDVEGLNRLADDPEVVSIGLDLDGHGDLYEAVPAIGATQVQKNLGFTGLDVPVAVLDSGVDKTIADLAGRVIAEHCFTQGTCAPNGTTESDDASDDAGHGTNVAAVIASQGALAGRGFAPGAKLVAVRVLDNHGTGVATDWMAGLDWVLTNLDTQPVKIVNMSLGSSNLFQGNCDDAVPEITDLITQLNAAGVTVFASSGNNGSSDSMQLPACITGVISVGATYDKDVGREPDSGDYHMMFPELSACFDATTGLDTVTCFTNSDATLDIVAPGAPIVSAQPGGALGEFWGTSESSPAAAGVAAMLLEANPGLSPASIESILKTTGKAVVDAKNDVSVPRIDALAAIRKAVCEGKADGEACDDGDSCSGTDACQAGICTGGAPAADGTMCTDGNGCSKGDACSAGVCTPTGHQMCPPSDACLFVLGCSPADGQCLAVDFNGGGACDDGKDCTTNDKCTEGMCAGKATTCPEPDECHAAASCTEADGGCPDPAPLDDGTECSIGTCVGGVCTPPDDAPAPTPKKKKKKAATPPDNSGCGCSVAGTMDGGLSIALAITLTSVALTRRRAKRGSAS